MIKFRFLSHSGISTCINHFNRHYSNKNILCLKDRGLFSDVFPDNYTSELLDLLNTGQQTVYAGFDPTASSLHIGNLLVIINLIHWQRAGHKVVALLGGATGRVGDPSGRSTERQALEAAVVDHNTSCIKTSIKNIFKNHEEHFWKKENQYEKLPPVKVVNNLEWYQEMNALDLLGKVGRHFRVGTMLGKQSVRDRMDSQQGISFTEFSYQVLQAYDWLYLCQKHKCRFQIGGHDQMGNMVAGYDLIQKILDKKVFGMTLPLITTTEGDKFGKSAGNAIWLSQEQTPVFNLYQFFVRARDDEVEKLLKLFTFEPLGRIKDVMESHKKNPESRVAQKWLAECVTLLVHGEEGLQHALNATSALYVQDIDALKRLNVGDFSSIFGGTISKILLQPGLTVLDAAMKAGCFQTESDAIRIITAGGFSINHKKMINTDEVLTKTCHILPNNISLMRVGKKNYTIVLWTS